MKKTEDKSVIYKSLWIMGTVMILAVLIIELVSIFLIQRDRRKTVSYTHLDVYKRQAFHPHS